VLEGPTIAGMIVITSQRGGNQPRDLPMAKAYGRGTPASRPERAALRDRRGQASSTAPTVSLES